MHCFSISCANMQLDANQMAGNLLPAILACRAGRGMASESPGNGSGLARLDAERVRCVEILFRRLYGAFSWRLFLGPGFCSEFRSRMGLLLADSGRSFAITPLDDCREISGSSPGDLRLRGWTGIFKP